MSGSNAVNTIKAIVETHVQDNSFIKRYNAYTLSEVYDIISNIISEEVKLELGQSLWFRVMKNTI